MANAVGACAVLENPHSVHGCKPERKLEMVRGRQESSSEQVEAAS